MANKRFRNADVRYGYSGIGIHKAAGKRSPVWLIMRPHLVEVDCPTVGSAMRAIDRYREGTTC